MSLEDSPPRIQPVSTILILSGVVVSFAAYLI